MRKLWIICLLLNHGIFAANAMEIHVNIIGLTYDTIWFGHTYGRKSYPDFPVIKQADGTYIIKTTNEYPSGFYAIIFKPRLEAVNNYFSVIVNESEHHFDLTCNVGDVNGTIKFTQAPQNTAFYDYKYKIGELRNDYKDLNTNFRILGDEASYALMIEKEDEIARLNAKFMVENPGTLLSKFIQKTAFNVPKIGNDWNKHIQKRKEYFLGDFFANFDPNDGLIWSTPLGIDWLDHATFKVCDPNPKSAYVFAEKLISLLEKYPDAYKYYMTYMLNSFDRMSQFGFDQVYVDLVKNYVETGKTPWFNDEVRQKHISQATNLGRVSVGQIAQDATFKDEIGYQISVYSIKSKYKMLLFWHPDCGHCKKELPVIKKLNPELMSHGIEVMAICMQNSKLVQSCWPYPRSIEMPENWHYVADSDNSSGFRVKYNVTTYPMVIILDENNKIVYQRRGEVEELEFHKMIEKLN